jgi:hypothetical protein
LTGEAGAGAAAAVVGVVWSLLGLGAGEAPQPFASRQTENANKTLSLNSPTLARQPFKVERADTQFLFHTFKGFGSRLLRDKEDDWSAFNRRAMSERLEGRPPCCPCLALCGYRRKSQAPTRH